MNMENCRKLCAVRIKQGYDFDTTLHIKQEAKEYHPLPQIDEEKYEYHCPQCVAILADLPSFWDHFKSSHDFRIQRGIFTTSDRQRSPVYTTSEDELKANYFCNICKAFYHDTRMYKQHFHHVHHVSSNNPLANASSNFPDPCDINGRCRACERTFSSKQDYTRHLYLVHKIECRPSKLHLVLNRRNPNPDDPNHYCGSCLRKLKTRRNYELHLLKVHAMRTPEAQTDGIFPDENDPHNHCSVCKKDYKHSKSYRYHLESKHKMIIGYKDLTVLPDPLNPNLYCVACNRTYKTCATYRSHCELTHRMKRRKKERRRTWQPETISS